MRWYVVTLNPTPFPIPERARALHCLTCARGRTGTNSAEPQNKSLAAEPSESANNPRAQTYLGTLFYEGRGITQDHDEAVKWFRRGARQGNHQACQNLGICYQTGTGVAKDLPKAVELFRQAVEAGRYGGISPCGALRAIPFGQMSGVEGGRPTVVFLSDARYI